MVYIATVIPTMKILKIKKNQRLRRVKPLAQYQGTGPFSIHLLCNIFVRYNGLSNNRAGKARLVSWAL